MSAPRYISTVAATRPANTTAYTALDVIGGTTAALSIFEFTIAPNGGAPMVILSASLRWDAAALPSGAAGTRLHLFNESPTGIADNSAFNLIAADRDKYLGVIPLGTPADLGDTLYVEDDYIRKSIVATGSSIFGVAQTVIGFTPTSGAVLNWTLQAVTA